MEFGKIYIPLFNFLISNALHCILLPKLKWFQDRRNWLWELGVGKFVMEEWLDGGWQATPSITKFLSFPPSLIPALQNIGILHHKKGKLRKHMRQSVQPTKNSWGLHQLKLLTRKTLALSLLKVPVRKIDVLTYIKGVTFLFEWIGPT